MREAAGSNAVRGSRSSGHRPRRFRKVGRRWYQMIKLPCDHCRAIRSFSGEPLKCDACGSQRAFSSRAAAEGSDREAASLWAGESKAGRGVLVRVGVGGLLVLAAVFLVV